MKINAVLINIKHTTSAERTSFLFELNIVFQLKYRYFCYFTFTQSLSVICSTVSGKALYNHVNPSGLRFCNGRCEEDRCRITFNLGRWLRLHGNVKIVKKILLHRRLIAGIQDWVRVRLFTNVTIIFVYTVTLRYYYISAIQCTLDLLI